MTVRYELVVDESVIMKGQRVVVTKLLQREYLKQLHKRHKGVEATKRQAHQKVYWTTINADIESYVAQCGVCNAYRPHQQMEDLKPCPVPELPWQIFAVNQFEWHGREYMMLADSFSEMARGT